MAIPFEDSINRTTATPRFTDEVFADLTARDAYASTLRYEGMSCYVESEAKNYQLQGGITNSDWVEIGTGGGGGGSGLNFQPYNLSGAIKEFVNDLGIERFTFYQDDESIIASMVLTEEWSSQKKLSFNVYSESSPSDYYAFAVNSTLVKNGTSPSGSITRNDATADVEADTTMTRVSATINETDGTIDGEIPSSGDLLILKISKTPASSSPVDGTAIYVLPSTVGVEDV